MITVSHHNKMEWSRMAQAAYRSDRNGIGHFYSAAASLPNGSEMSAADYDFIQDGYRAWLVFGEWPS